MRPHRDRWVLQVSDFNTRAYCYLGTCGLVGPTIELYPGACCK